MMDQAQTLSVLDLPDELLLEVDQAQTLSVLDLPDELLLEVDQAQTFSVLDLPDELLLEVDQAQTLSVLDLPDELLLEVFMSLPLQSLMCVSLTCSRFSCIICDDNMWKTMFQRDFKAPQSVPLRPKASSWRAEYRRLYDESPAVLCEEVLDEVLHVSISHNGEMLTTCSKDRTVKVWSARTPFTLRFTADMNARLGWQYTHYAQFNKADTLLLVSGAIEEDINGEVVVFDLEQDPRLVSHFLNTPLDGNGAWYDNCHLLCGTLRDIGTFESISALWLAKASREVKSDRKYAMINPFRFKNYNNGCTGLFMVADVPIDIDKCQSTSDKAFDRDSKCGRDVLPADLKEAPVQCGNEQANDSNGTPGCVQRSLLPTHDSTTSVFKQKHESDIPGSLRTEKLLICTRSEVAHYPQIVGIKRMTEEEIIEEEEATEGLQWPETVDDFLPHDDSLTGGSGRITNIDYTFNMHGHILGMALSPDHRYLYVNIRSWPDEYVINDVMVSPPISENVDIHVIDLVTLTKVDTVFRSHKAYTDIDFCFYLCVVVNDLYFASGAEDNQGYMWDRHYGVHVRCFPHDDVVSCCAFNPMDPEMLVTGSEDDKIKIWRSRRRMREMREREEREFQAFDCSDLVETPSSSWFLTLTGDPVAQ